MNGEHEELKTEEQEATRAHNKERGGASIALVNKLYETGGALLVAFAFLIPIFFIPSPFYPFTAGKLLALTVFVLVAALIVVVYFLRQGHIEVPKHPLFIAAVSVPVVYALSSIFAVSGLTMSVAGYGMEVYTFASVLLLFVLFFATFFLLKKNTYIFYFYLAVTASALLLALFFLTRFIFGPEFLSLGFFNSLAASPLESWNAVAVLFATVFLLALLTFEMFKLRALFRWILGVVIAVSAFFLILINATWLWVTLGAIVLLFIVLRIVDPKKDESEKLPFLSIGFIFVVVAFVFFGDPYSAMLSESIGVGSDEIRPSLEATLGIAQSTMTENPIRAVAGAGPLDFSYQWLQYKPEGILETNFWNIEFGQGFSFPASTPTTTGLLGLVAWAAFFLLFFYVVGRKLFTSFNDVFTRYAFMSSVAVSILLIVSFSVMLLPAALVTLLFMFTAIPLAVLMREKELSVMPVNLTTSDQKGSAAIVVTVILAGLLLLFGAFLVQRNVSGLFFEQSAFAFYGQGDIGEAESRFQWATNFSEQDRYYRLAAEFPIARIQNTIPLLGQEGGVSEEDFLQATAGEFRLALARAERATELRPSSYRNWVTLGGVYQEMLAFNFTDVEAYDEAYAAYETAREHNPRNPALLLQHARLELVNENIEGARQYTQEALDMKPNYANALFFSSQLDVEEGLIDSAIESIQGALSVEPFDPGLYFQLGLLHFENNDMEEASAAFTQATRLAPQFDNAWYFLGLALYNMDQEENAITIFENLAERYENRPQLMTILENMREGVANPLADVADFEEPTPELPIQEEVPEADGTLDGLEGADETLPEDITDDESGADIDDLPEELEE